jgi:hypothetical protein
MKNLRIVLILIVFFLTSDLFSQSQFCYTTAFNVDVSKISKELKPAIIYKLYIDSLDYTDDCKIKLFAYIVDSLFSYGLDLDYKHKIPVRDNTIDFGVDVKQNVQSEPNKTNQMQMNLYETFLEVKKCHGYYYSEKDQSKLVGYASIVENVIKFGIFNHSIEVEKFLRFEFKKLTKEKYQDNKDKNGYDW